MGDTPKEADSQIGEFVQISKGHQFNAETYQLATRIEVCLFAQGLSTNLTRQKVIEVVAIALEGAGHETNPN